MISKNLPMGGELHKTILTAVKERKELSNQKMSNFRRQWDRADDSMKAYIKEKDIDAIRRSERELEGQPHYITLEVPYTYAVVMTAHTYFTSTLLGRSPVYQFSGRHGETQDAIMAVEAVMDYQNR